MGIENLMRSLLKNVRVLFVSFVLVILNFSICTAFAVDSSEIERVMREYQNKYHYVAIIQNHPTKFLQWDSKDCVAAPSYPMGFYGNITVDEAEELVNDIVGKFYNGEYSKIYNDFIENPEGQETIVFLDLSEPNETDTWQSKLSQVDTDLDKLTRYFEGCGSTDSLNKSGNGNSQNADWDSCGNNDDITISGSFNDAKSQAEGDWSSASNPLDYKGIYAVSSLTKSCDNDCNGADDYTGFSENWSVYLASENLKLTEDLTKHSGTAKCYVNAQILEDASSAGSPVPSGLTIDGKYHSWGSPTVGDVWTSGYLFEDSPPVATSPSSVPCDDNSSIFDGWQLNGYIVYVSPSYSNQSDPVIAISAPTEKIFKNTDKYIVYSAAKGCGYDTGETVSGRIIINDYVPSVGFRLEVKLESQFSEDLAEVKFYERDSQGVYSTTIDNTDIERVYCFGPQQDDPNGSWYVPFKISSKIGQGNIKFSLASVYSGQLGEGAGDPNEEYRMKTYRGESDVEFQVKTNGYECCNRKPTVNNSVDEPQITKHENGDVEMYFPDIDQSFIWGNYSYYMTFWSYSQTCEFIEENITDIGNGEIEISTESENSSVYNTSGGWDTSGSASTATFDSTIDDNGDTITYASYDGYGRLSAITNAASPSNLYRVFGYDDANEPNRITSYTDYAGNISRTYTLVYDTYGRVAGTIGGTGSGCSSCCSDGGNTIYNFNDDGFVLTESDLTGNVVYEYEYDAKNRLIATWLGEKTDMHPIQEVVYDTNGASGYGGSEIQDVYDYINDSDYRFKRNILDSAGNIIIQIKFDDLNINAANIPSDVNSVIANGGYITTYEHYYSGGSLDYIKTKSPLFNEGEIDNFQKRTFRNSDTGVEKEFLIIVDANDTENEIQLSELYFDDGRISSEYNWYALLDSSARTLYSYNSSTGRLSSRYDGNIDQLNGDYTRLRYDYAYYPDGRLDTETVSNNYQTGTELITINLYDDVNLPIGTQAVDYDNFQLYDDGDPYNILYETYSKSNGLGDVIYTIDRKGIARGKEYDSGGKVISEFVFAEPNDTTLFDNATFNDISSVYDDINVVSQSLFYYDDNGKLEYKYTAVDDKAFTYHSPSAWNIIKYVYDSYGRKTQQIEGYPTLNYTTIYQYNNQGQLVKTTYPDGHWVKNVYNGRGLVSKTIEGYGSETTDPNDFIITETVFDADGRVLKTIKGGTVVSSYEYDSLNNIYRQYQGDYTSQYCDFVQFERNYAGDLISQKFVDVNPTTGIETVIQETAYRKNGRGETIEERVFADPNTDPNGISESGDSTDKITLFSYDHLGNLIESVTKGDDCNVPYTDQYMEEINYEQGDHVRQNYYDVTGQLIYNVSFDAKEICYYDWFLMQNVCNVKIPFDYSDSDANNLFSFAKDINDIYIAQYNYLNSKLDNKKILIDYNEAHSDFYDYENYNDNHGAGLVWRMVSRFEYDSTGRYTKTIDADDNYTEVAYNSLNLPTENTLYQGKQVLRLNDANNIDPNFNPYPLKRSLTAYDTLGRKTRSVILKDPNVNTGIADINMTGDFITDYVYDANGKLYREKQYYDGDMITNFVSAYTQYNYDSLGRVEQIINGELEEVDVFGSIWETPIPLKYTTYQYNDMGQKDIQTITDVNTIDNSVVDVNTYYYYDRQGRVTDVYNEDGRVGKYYYDTLGRKTATIDAHGMLTLNYCDGLGNLYATIEDANNLQRTTYFGYDRNNRRTSISSGSDTTTYTYNYLGKIDSITYPDNKVIEYGYDMLGNVTSRTITENSNSVTTHYKRNILGRIAFKQYSNDPNWNDPNTALPFDEILYDGAGNKSVMASIDDGSDLELAMYYYDGLGNLTNSAEAYSDLSYNVIYGYDQRGLLKAIYYPEEKLVEYARDALGRIISVSYNGKQIVQYYWLGDKVIGKEFDNNISYTTVIDALGRVDAEQYGNLTFDYDYSNHTSRLTDRNTSDYGYDTLGRVDQEDSTTFTFDILGNPTNATEDNLTYGLDNENRVVDVNDGSGIFASYKYDRLGRRTSKTVDSNTVCFAYDKMGDIITEYARDGNDTDWLRDYVYGANGELVYMDLPDLPPVSSGADIDDFIDFCVAWLCYPDCNSSDLNWDYNSDNNIDFEDWAYHEPNINDVNIFYGSDNGRYILTDFMGSVVGIAKEDGTAVEISYNAWGTPSYSGNIDGLSILWNGYYSDAETGNYYLRNRYYSPLERKFITDDPHGILPDEIWNNQFNPMRQYIDGFGLTVYANSDPVNNEDKWGLFYDPTPWNPIDDPITGEPLPGWGQEPHGDELEVPGFTLSPGLSGSVAFYSPTLYGIGVYVKVTGTTKVGSCCKGKYLMNYQKSAISAEGGVHSGSAGIKQKLTVPIVENLNICPAKKKWTCKGIFKVSARASVFSGSCTWKYSSGWSCGGGIRIPTRIKDFISYRVTVGGGVECSETLVN